MPSTRPPRTHARTHSPSACCRFSRSCWRAASAPLRFAASSAAPRRCWRILASIALTSSTEKLPASMSLLLPMPCSLCPCRCCCPCPPLATPPCSLSSESLRLLAIIISGWAAGFDSSGFDLIKGSAPRPDRGAAATRHVRARSGWEMADDCAGRPDSR